MEEVVYFFRNLFEDYFCKKVLVKCEVNVMFLIDMKVLSYFNDWKVDDLGVFNNVGKVIVGYFYVIVIGVCFLLKKKLFRVEDKNVVLLKKMYWIY